MAKVKDCREVAIFSDKIREDIGWKPLVNLADRHCVVALKRIFPQFCQKIANPVDIAEIGKTVHISVNIVRRQIPIGEVFFQVASASMRSAT